VQVRNANRYASLPAFQLVHQHKICAGFKLIYDNVRRRVARSKQARPSDDRSGPVVELFGTEEPDGCFGSGIKLMKPLAV